MHEHAAMTCMHCIAKVGVHSSTHEQRTHDCVHARRYKPFARGGPSVAKVVLDETISDACTCVVCSAAASGTVLFWAGPAQWLHRLQHAKCSSTYATSRMSGGDGPPPSSPGIPMAGWPLRRLGGLGDEGEPPPAPALHASHYARCPPSVHVLTHDRVLAGR